MAGDVAVREPTQKKGTGLRRMKRRVAIRIDMTPMVDVAFLLLIFFMVTTVFRQPQAMEMNLPPKDAKVQVAASNVMSLFVAANRQMLWQMGEVGKGTLATTTMKDLHQLFIDNAKLNPDLIILVKVNRTAPYETMVDIMDELEIANMSKFSLIPMTEDESKMIEAHL
jgi:biopolymer transport protein ExbD